VFDLHDGPQVPVRFSLLAWLIAVRLPGWPALLAPVARGLASPVFQLAIDGNVADLLVLQDSVGVDGEVFGIS